MPDKYDFNNNKGQVNIAKDNVIINATQKLYSPKPFDPQKK